VISATGVVTGITVTNAGSGYTAPVVTISGYQFDGTLDAGPAANFSNSITLGFLSGTMSADVGDIFSMGFTSTLTDPNGDGQVTLQEMNTLAATSFFSTSLANPVVGLELDLELQVSGGGATGALPGIGNTMSITWTKGDSKPTLSYDNFYLDLGSFISDYMAPIATRLGPITSGVQPILNALDYQIPVLGDIIGGDTSLLGLANRYGGANIGFLNAVNAIVDMVNDITSAVDYVQQNPGQDFLVPLDVIASFADDFRTAASGLSKPQQIENLPSQQDVVNTINSFLGKYQGAVANNFTQAAKKVVNANSSYGVSGGLGISFDAITPQSLVNMLTGQTADLFTITFPSLAANFSLDESFPLDPPLYMTFGGGVNASLTLAMGMDTAGLEIWIDALEAAIKADYSGVNSVSSAEGDTESTATTFETFLSPTALEGLALEVIEDGLYIDGSQTEIQAGGSLSLGLQLNAGIARANLDGSFGIEMTMTPNADSSGRLTLGEILQLAGDDFSSPLNLFDFGFSGTISADASLQLYLPFHWQTVWSHNFGSYTIFDVQNDPAPPTSPAASQGSLFLNMGPTAARRGPSSAGVKDEHFEIRHLGGVAGNETVSVQFYVAGVAQYVDGQGNPAPQVYSGVTSILAYGGDGADIVDCTGVLSPTRIDGGAGSDTLRGGLGVNVITGGSGNDTIAGGPRNDILYGGDGHDAIEIGGGGDTVQPGPGQDTLSTAAGGGTTAAVFSFENGFGTDSLPAAVVAGATLDFSAVTTPLTVTLGSSGRISAGGTNVFSWTGAGPAKIILGSGHDDVTFNAGYSALTIDPGIGRDRFVVTAFEPNVVVTIAGQDTIADDHFAIQDTAAQTVTLGGTGVTASNGGSFVIAASKLRKLSVGDTSADVVIDFAGVAPDLVNVSARSVAFASLTQGKTIKTTGAAGVAVNANVSARNGGNVLLAAGTGGAVTVGGSAPASITTARGNVSIEAPRLVIGPSAVTPFAISGGGIDNDAESTAVPMGRALVGQTLLGPGGNYAGMYLAGRDLSSVDLTGASLTGANLTGANLFGANLRNTALGGASLAGANLLGVVSSSVTGTPASLPQGWSLTGGMLVRTTPAVASGIQIPAAGVYPVGTPLSFTVTFAEAVVVTGVPALTLGVGTVTRQAAYVAADSTPTQLVFRYTIQGGDVAPDGFVVPTTITLPAGAAVDDLGGNATSLVLPPAAGTGIQIANAPAPLAAAFSAPGYGAGQTIQVAVTFTRSVTVTGVPQIPLVMTPARTATYVSGSGTGTLVFEYLVQPGDASSGVALGSAIILPAGATIADSQATASALVLPVATGPAPVVDTVAPTIVGIRRPAAGWYGVGAPLTFTVAFSEPVTVAGLPFLMLSVGSRLRQATYMAGSGTTSLTFSYGVGRGDYAPTGVVAGGAVRLAAFSSLADAAGNAARLALTNSVRTNARVDGRVAVVQALAGPPAGTYRVGANLVFRVTFSRPVVVSGTPGIDLGVGSIVRTATYVRGSGTRTLVFSYRVQPGDSAPSGVTLGSAIVGGLLRDSIGNSASGGLPGFAGRRIRVVG
jgi:hypothetical protein